MTKLDLKGLKCPLPVLKTRKALKALATGDRLEVAFKAPGPLADLAAEADGLSWPETEPRQGRSPSRRSSLR